MKKPSRWFWVFALILSHTLCIAGAWNVSALLHCPGCSAPAWTGLLSAVPFAVGSLLCVGAAILLHRRGK